MKSLRKNIAISLLLHAVAIFLVLQGHHSVRKQKEPEKKKTSEVELDSPKKPKTAGTKIIFVSKPIKKPDTLPDNKKIVPLSPIHSSNSPKLLKNGYYGIGVYIDMFHEVALCDGQQYVGILINGVVDGYPGQALGLRANDVIIEVDGRPIGQDNDIIGPGPTMVNFTICRDHKKLFFTTTRAFIYND